MGRPARFTRTDEFAELLAEGASLAEAGTRMGMSRAYADMVLYRIRKRLGGQAR
jgi:DNA-binding CsgD family transcriptional regulator